VGENLGGVRWEKPKSRKAEEQEIPIGRELAGSARYEWCLFKWETKRKF